MKHNLITYILGIFLLFLNPVLSNEVFIESDNIKILEEGNIINAFKSKAIDPLEQIEIEGDETIYDKEKSKLTIINNVKFLDKKKNIYIEAEKLIYNKSTNIINSIGKTFIKIEDKHEMYSENVYYDRNLMEIYSKKETIIYDNKENVFNLEDFFKFDIIKEIISSDKTNIIDNENNSYNFEKVKINLKTNELAGKEVNVDFIDSFFGDENQDPRLKGKTTVSNDKKTQIHKAVFTTCNTENKKCPGWEIESDEFIHNKVKKTFEYKNAWLKIFGQKAFFTPYISHPDPSVKRQSGFLTPSYSLSENSSHWVNVPYFKVISEDKDATFNPRLYADDRFILQTEYRQAFENSNLTTDFSYNNDGDHTNTHFFYYLDGNSKDEKTEYTVKFQSVSNDEYLKIHDLVLTSPIIEDDSTLTSDFGFYHEFDDDTNLSAEFSRYEDLSKKDSDRFQYVFPNFNFTKNININERYNGNFKFISNGFQKNYDTNKYEVLLNNDFLFESNDLISSTGILTNYDFLIKSFNTYSENSSNYKDKNDHEVYGSLMLKSSYPLVKNNDNSSSYLTPILSARYSPNNTNDISGNSTTINYDNIMSFNRIGTNDMVEGGRSLAFGVEYEIRDNINDEALFGIHLANSITDKKNENLPSKSKLDQTRNDIVGKLFYKPNKYLDLNYNFSYDRDLDGSNQDSLNAALILDNFVTEFSYHSQNEMLGDNEIISNSTKYWFNSENNLKFKTTRNLQTDFTEYYNLVYSYETDCLIASLTFNKKFYRDQNLIPDETLIFQISFIPFIELKPETIALNKYTRN